MLMIFVIDMKDGRCVCLCWVCLVLGVRSAFFRKGLLLLLLLEGRWFCSILLNFLNATAQTWTHTEPAIVAAGGGGADAPPSRPERGVRARV